MPVYEYYCPETHTVYTFFARSLAEGGKVPRCPDPKGRRMIKEMSGFAITGRHAEHGDAAGTDADDSRMEQAMASLEREFASLDENNPDPRHLGAMMRRMSELTGERLPPELDEAARRLESGEDPDAVEASLGDLDDTDSMDANPAGAGSLSQRIRGLRQRQGVVRRDPVLYELRDWL